MRQNHGFTLLELAIVLVIVVVVIGTMLPMLGYRRPPPQMQNHIQVRVIHQNMVIYAQGNNSYYPGLDSEGEAVNLTVEGRLQVLLDAEYLTGDYLIAPRENLTAWTPGTPLTTANYSYALLQIDTDGARRDEWRDTVNSLAAVVSDRNTGTGNTTASVQSIWTTTGGDWTGCVAWNDNHVSFENTCVMDQTQYGESPQLADDSLFLDGDATPVDESPATSGNDALLIHSGR